jgi:transcription termination factor Rho
MEDMDLTKKTREELKQIAQGMGLKRISTLKKSELIEVIQNHSEPAAPAAPVIEDSPEGRGHVHTRPSDVVEVKGVLEVMADGFGFLRSENYRPSSDDIYVSPTQIRRFSLKTGDEIVGDTRPSQEEDKYSPLLFVKTINGGPINEALRRRPFEKLTAIYPKEKFQMETCPEYYAMRLLDVIAPIGKGQRGIIVAPPKAGKTTLIKQIAKSISTNYPKAKLIVLLIDERPEEVTDMKRSIDGEVIFSTFDQPPENHTKVAEMVLERAQRLVEQKQDVVILLDSITRLARAYNLTVTPTGRTLSGGLDPDALFKPKRFFGAARNIEEGGSLTILATALVETGSRMDDVIFEEFKGTGNMELRLDRSLQERRIFPAIDILRSGTRREEDLLSPKELEAVWAVRREMEKQSSGDTVSLLLNYLTHTKNNEEFIDMILRNYGKR